METLRCDISPRRAKIFGAGRYSRMYPATYALQLCTLATKLKPERIHYACTRRGTNWPYRPGPEYPRVTDALSRFPAWIQGEGKKKRGEGRQGGISFFATPREPACRAVNGGAPAVRRPCCQDGIGKSGRPLRVWYLLREMLCH